MAVKKPWRSWGGTQQGPRKLQLRTKNSRVGDTKTSPNFLREFHNLILKIPRRTKSNIRILVFTAVSLSQRNAKCKQHCLRLSSAVACLALTLLSYLPHHHVLSFCLLVAFHPSASRQQVFTLSISLLRLNSSLLLPALYFSRSRG